MYNLSLNTSKPTKENFPKYILTKNGLSFQIEKVVNGHLFLIGIGARYYNYIEKRFYNEHLNALDLVPDAPDLYVPKVKTNRNS